MGYAGNLNAANRLLHRTSVSLLDARHHDKTVSSLFSCLQLRHPCGVMPDRVVTLMKRHIAAQAKAYPRCFTGAPPVLALGTWELPSEIINLSYTSPQITVRLLAGLFGGLHELPFFAVIGRLVYNVAHRPCTACRVSLRVLPCLRCATMVQPFLARQA